MNTLNKNVLITGMSGFVGQNLYDYLRSFYCLKQFSIRYISNQKFDLNGDAIIHLAGKAHDLKKVSDPSVYYESNFELTKQLFDAFLTSKLSVFIFMSTVKAVADDVDGVLAENTIPNPKTHYGIAKRQAEEYLLSKKVPYNKRVYILRPCMIHGPGNKGNLNLLYKIVSKGLPWPLGDFDNKRSFLSIENLCFVIKELLANDNIPSGVYQVADDAALSTNELIKLIGRSMDRKSRIWNIPSSLITTMAKAGGYLPIPLNPERLQKLTESYQVSNKKLLGVLGKQLPVSAEQGLLHTFASFKTL